MAAVKIIITCIITVIITLSSITVVVIFTRIAVIISNVIKVVTEEK